MLRHKTEGNLDSSEGAMLENVLFDLRMRYVDLARKSRSTVQGQDKDKA
jgi:hypothetical protein